MIIDKLDKFVDKLLSLTMTRMGLIITIVILLGILEDIFLGDQWGL